MIPKVEFVYSHPYDGALMSMIGKKYNKRWENNTLKFIKKIEKRWRKMEKKVLKEMSVVSGIKWDKEEICCYMVNFCSTSFSTPLTIKLRGRNGKYKRIEDICYTLIHELIHVLQQTGGIRRIKKLGWDTRFKNCSQTTKNHIYLDAVFKHVYLKFFDKSKFEEDIEWDRSTTGYREAWQMVDKYDHENLLKELRNAVK
jgi:hypothetical protein